VPTGTLWDHMVRMMEYLEGSISFPLAFAALLHGIGKPRVLAQSGEQYTFQGHERVARQMVETIADRLRLSSAEKSRSAWLVEHQEYLTDAATMRLSQLKTILVQPGIDDLLALHRADAMARGGSLEAVEFCERILRETPQEELDPSPVLTGDDLKALGMKPGPEFKRLLDAVRVAQLEGQVTTKDQALELVRALRAAPPPAPDRPRE
jgi:poly(A) polymerase